MPQEAAERAVREFIRRFNEQDHDALADTLNYPHVRLAAGRFVTIEDRAEFILRSQRGQTFLAEERWHHTTIEDFTVIQAGDDKVHVAMNIARRRDDDAVYQTFETLWIVTCQDGHWGIQFRSSFLEG